MHISDKELDEWLDEYIDINTEFGQCLYNLIHSKEDIQTIVNPKRMSLFLSSVTNINKYCAENCDCNFEIVMDIFNTSKNNADYTITFDEISFDKLSELTELIDGASWMCLGVSNDNRVSLTVEFWDCATEIK